MVLKLNSNSRYKNTIPILTQDGNETFGIMKKFPFMETQNTGEILITDPKYRYRPDILAADIYNDQNLFWVLIMFNKPSNVWRWPEINTVVKYPLRSEVIPYI